VIDNLTRGRIQRLVVVRLHSNSDLAAGHELVRLEWMPALRARRESGNVPAAS
jgi:hypothetical protein